MLIMRGKRLHSRAIGLHNVDTVFALLGLRHETLWFAP